jgi:hypothetical protein
VVDFYDRLMAIIERHFFVGQALYGRRDFFPDGSFVTTQWFAFMWVPLVPMWSKRVSVYRTSVNAVRDPTGWWVHDVTAPNLKQVLCVYAWCAAMIAPVLLWGRFQDDLARLLGDEDRAAGLCLLALAVIGSLPYVLRRLAKRLKAREWERARLGLSPPLR